MTKYQKKNMAILKKAAQLLLTGHDYACFAIKCAEQGHHGALKIFESIFMADANVLPNTPWWRYEDDLDYETKEARIFALLLTAEMIRTDSLP